MQSIFKPLIISSVLAASAMLVQAQTAPAGGGMVHARAQHEHGHGRMDPARMQERMAARMAELKAKLGLTAAQEGAWNDYTAALQPPANQPRMGRDERRRLHEEMQAMTTPQRLDRMAAMKAERDARMQLREQATRNFYDALTPAQQKVFDAETSMGAGHGKGGHRRHG